MDVSNFSDFSIFVDSTDPLSLLTGDNKASFTASFHKPIVFPQGVWEVGLKQILFKPSFLLFPENGNKIYYISPDNPDEKENLSSIEVVIGNDKPIESLKDVAKAISSSIPPALKSNFIFSIDKAGFAVMKLRDTQVKFESIKLANFLGFNTNKFYPPIFPTKQIIIRGEHKIIIPKIYQVFKVLVDFTVPEVYGSKNMQIIGLDMLNVGTNGVVTYKYENPTYCIVIRSYIQSINIKIVDINDNPIELSDPNFPIILKFHFRKNL